MANGYLFELPDFETEDGNSNEAVQQRLRRLEKYLYNLNEQLRYSMYNLDDDNLSENYRNKLEAQNAEFYAKLEVTAGEINSTVSALDGRMSEVSQTVDGIQSTVTGLGGNMSQITQRVDGIQSTVTGITGNMSQISQTVDNISFDVYNSSGSVASQIQAGINGIKLTADNITIRGTTKLSSIFKSGTTIIDGGHIDTGSISLDELLVGDSSYMYMSGRDLYLYGSRSGDGIYIGNPSTWVYIDNGMSVYDDLIVHGQITMNNSGNIADVGQLHAYSGIFDGWCYAPKWEEPSDRDLKHDISTLDAEQMASFIKALEPVSYRLNGDKENQTRLGFVAQEVKASLESLGLDEGNGPIYHLRDGVYSMSYTDLIAPLTAVVQGLTKRIEALEARING